MDILKRQIASSQAEKKRITREEKQTTITENGEIIEQTSFSSSWVESEPNFIKIYLDNIMFLNNLQTNNADVLHEILKEMRYDGKIVLTAHFKKDIAERLGNSLQTINNAITQLVKKELLIRIDRGIYLANPFIFGKGRWEDIKRIRYELIMTTNGMEQKAEMEYNSEELEQLKVL